jgi:hypothetical protein
LKSMSISSIRGIILPIRFGECISLALDGGGLKLVRLKLERWI